MTSLAFRLATPDDLAGLVALERAAFARPWHAAIHAEELRRETSRVEVALADDRIVGASVAWLVAEECHLLRIAVDPQRRRERIGSRLLVRLIADARAEPCTVVLLEVGAANAAALGLYAAAGFARVGLRPRYYTDPPEDAVLMTLRL
jgi:ribosomal-protein-alanine N-acetyltransferase